MPTGNSNENRINITNLKLVHYLKIAMVVLLVAIEVVVCAYAATDFVETGNLGRLLTVIICCVSLAVLECLNSFIVRHFILKMAFYAVDMALLLIICIFTGNSLLSTLYCIVLTLIYTTIERFRDKAMIFGVSCSMYATSFIIGWLFSNADTPVYSSVVQIISGLLFGLLAIVLDFIVVQFLLTYYRNNEELSAALKEADDSRSQLEKAYEQLSETAVFEERNRIAKDIHDNAGHSMTTVIMQTEAAKLLMDKDPEEAKNRIISANMQARNALEQMRESVHLLAGRNVQSSLKEELEEIFTQTTSGTDIKVRADLEDLKPSAEERRFLCNSLKECLANGIRHGKATAFYVELKEIEGVLKLYISDNGLGASGELMPGFGLNGMQEKAAVLGGNCIFKSERGEGFEVEITLPLSPNESNKEEL